MPRRKYWKMSAAKQDLRTDVTEDPGLVKNRKVDIDLTEDPGLGKNRNLDLTNNVTEDPGLGKNRNSDCEDPALLKTGSLKANLKVSQSNLKANTKANGKANTKANKKATEKSCAKLQRQHESLMLNEKIADYESTVSNMSGVTETIWASFSQADRRFSDVSRDRQCTCNALMMLLYSKQANHITSSLLDEVLLKGDELYHTVLSNLMQNGKFKSYLLEFEELPSTIHAASYNFSIVKENILLGTIVEMPDLPFCQTLHSAIQEMFQQTQMGLIITGAICSAVWKDQLGRFLFFDSHSHGNSLLSSPRGKALLVCFLNFDDLLGYMYVFYNSLKISFDHQFELQPITVIRNDSLAVEENTNQKMISYFKHQREMLATKRDTNKQKQDMVEQRKLYNREYKRKQRQQVQFRSLERDSKRKERSGEAYRNKERVCELQSKQKARNNEAYRKKERDYEVKSKQKARNDETFRSKERNYEQKRKRKARSDEVFRNEEKAYGLKSKKRARTDKQFKLSERDQKRNARTDETFRQKECASGLKSKQKARESLFFQEKERVLKQLSRQNSILASKENSRDKELKQKCREDSEYRSREKAYKRGFSLTDTIQKFHSIIADGPVYVCTSCHQTWFRHSVSQLSQVLNPNPFVYGNVTGYKSKDNKEWICRTCLSTLKKGKLPALSVANKMSFPKRPSELDLHQLEERLVALRIPFMQMRELPRGGQLSIRGNVVNVPVDVQPTIKALPHHIEDTTIPVRLKRRMTYKKCEFTENVRPKHVLVALHWLFKNSELYKNSGVQLDEEWLTKTTNDAKDIVKSFMDSPSYNKTADELNKERDEYKDEGNESDTFSEIADEDRVIGNADTLIEQACPQNDSTYTFAPGEGQHPLSLYVDRDSEYLSFPTIFCGQRRPDNSERKVKVHYSDIAKWELRNIDRRAANSVPNIFFKMKKIQMKQISDKVNLAVRRCKTKDKKVTAAEALDPSRMNKLVNLDEGFYIFRTLRNSPPYLEKRKKDVFAMIRQLGIPTWFCSLSAGDTRWYDLLKILGQLNENISYTDEQISKMTWNEKTRLVQKDPVTCARYFDHRVQQFINTMLKSDHAPLGKLKDYFYRVEFQHRGSPHIHMLMWIEDAPKYKVDKKEVIAEYVEKYTSCQADVEEELKPLVEIQTHRHSKTCRKKGKPVCRFGFPLPPMAKTMLLEPLDEENKTLKKKYEEIQRKLSSMKNLEEMTFDDFLREVAHMSEAEYITCVRSSLVSPKVFLKRKPSEIRVNAYMTSLARAWKANHDLQYVVEVYGCAVYVVSYIGKSQRGMSMLLDEACKEARKGNMDIKQQVRHIGNKFLNGVEISAQEAAYIVLQLPLTKATRDVVFINTSDLSERTFLLKQRDALEALPPDSTDIEADNVMKRYCKRPKQLEKMCLADYVSELDITYPKRKHWEHEETNDDDIETSKSDSDSDEESEPAIFSEWKKLTMKNGVIIKRRKNKRVIRYVRYSVKTDSENHFRERLLLFFPWRNEEVDLLGGFQTYEDHYNHVKQIVNDKLSQYEYHGDELDAALEKAQDDLRENFDEIAPMTQQTEQEDEEEGSHESKQFVYYKPESAKHKDYDIGVEIGVPQSSSQVEITTTLLPNEEYYQLIRTLNMKQREFFIHVLHWVKTKDEPLYAFLTGGAGVGKSVVIRALYQALHRYLCSKEGENPDDCKILLCAPTGKAAHNIGGNTIHAAFKILPNHSYKNYTVDCDTLNTLRVKYRNLSVVIIDEVSMVGNKMLLLLHECLQKVKGNQKELFGGVSVILIGDLYQLKPVMDKWIFEDLDDQMGPLATNLWQSLFTMHELTEIMRQKDDKQFAELLNRMRSLENDKLSDEDIASLQSRFVQPNTNYPIQAPHLFTTNLKVDTFNSEMFDKSEAEKVKIPSLDTAIGDLPQNVKEKLVRTLPDNITKTAGLMNIAPVAVGLAYEITANLDIADGLVNGACCHVRKIDYRQTNTDRPSIVWVEFEDEATGINQRAVYKHLRMPDVQERWTPIFDCQRTFLYNRKSFIRIQFPLRPAAAKTVHKSQGSTLKEVVVDMSAPRKQPHMHYVAFSRVKNLSGLYILNLNEEKISVDHAVKREMLRLQGEAMLQLCYIPPYTMSSTKLKVAFLNARSLQLHHRDIKNDYNIIAADVLAIAETKLKPSDKDETFALEGFNLKRNDQKDTRKPSHGLAVYFGKNVEALFISSFSSFDFECMILDVQKQNTNLQVAFVYKSPRCSYSKLKTQIEQHIKTVIETERKFIIAGDFNIDISEENESFVNWMEDLFGSKQVTSCVTTDKGSKLDLIFTNVNDTVSSVVECCWTDHKLVYCAI